MSKNEVNFDEFGGQLFVVSVVAFLLEKISMELIRYRHCLRSFRRRSASSSLVNR
jgi:hypothetical protein